jgi:hypothetical protein
MLFNGSWHIKHDHLKPDLNTSQGERPTYPAMAANDYKLGTSRRAESTKIYLTYLELNHVNASILIRGQHTRTAGLCKLIFFVHKYSAADSLLLGPISECPGVPHVGVIEVAGQLLATISIVGMKRAASRLQLVLR